MLRALLKKQFLELKQFYFRNRKTGKNRSKGAIVGYVILFLFVFATVAVMFFGISMMLADAFIPAGLDWLYFSMMGIMSLTLGVFGSVFNTYAGLYHAKDNELLLSMPIKPMDILLVRMIGVYAMSLLYTAIVWIPAAVVYWIFAPISVLRIVLPVLLLFVISALVSVLTCALGWVVALIASKLKNKSFVTVIISLLFFAAYYYAINRMNVLIQKLIAGSDKIGAAIKTWVYPVYQLGLGASGKIVPFLIFTAITAVLCVICVLILARGFVGIVTSEKGTKKAVYVEKSAKVSSVKGALLKRELKHLASSPTYMLNCGLGLVIAPVLAVFALVKQAKIHELLEFIEVMGAEYTVLVPVVMCALICLITSMNFFSAPSISLEGKGLWQIRSLPVRTKDVLDAKIKMHVMLNAFSALFTAISLGIVIRADIVTLILMTVLTMLYVVFTAMFGLLLNLKKPNLNWSSEVVPIKQSASVTITMFGGWGICVLFGGGYYFLRNIIDPKIYLALIILIFAAVTVLIYRYIKTKGCSIFEEL